MGFRHVGWNIAQQSPNEIEPSTSSTNKTISSVSKIISTEQQITPQLNYGVQHEPHTLFPLIHNVFVKKKEHKKLLSNLDLSS